MMDSIDVFRSFPRDSNDKGNVDVDQNIVNMDQNVVNVDPKYGQHRPNVLNMD